MTAIDLQYSHSVKGRRSFVVFWYTKHILGGNFVRIPQKNVAYLDFGRHFNMSVKFIIALHQTRLNSSMNKTIKDMSLAMTGSINGRL